MAFKDISLRPVGWILAVVIPMSVLYVSSAARLEWNLKYFLTIFSATIIMWMFRLSSEFIPCVFMIVATLILGIVPADIVLSGFTSGSFFMAMSVFGLAAVLVSSGLTWRFLLISLKYIPSGKFSFMLSIFFTGLFLTPVLPAANGRISLASPILKDIIKILGYSSSGRAATNLSITAFVSFTFFSSMFLSSKSINFVVYGLLPFQVREHFSWGFWIVAAAAAATVMIVLSFLLAVFMFRKQEIPSVSHEVICHRLNKLGRMKTDEWGALFGIIFFLLGILTTSIHKIPIPWIGVAVLYLLLALEFLSKNDFQKNINWSFLIYLGGLIGIGKSMSYVGLDRLLKGQIQWLSHYMNEHFMIFILLLFMCIFLARLFMPNNVVVVVFVAVLFPIAEAGGINPWVIGFIILNISDGWIFPYQCTYYLLFRELTQEDNLYNEKTMLTFNVISNFIKLAAILISVYYWRLIGIL